jgi:hypothetical protein
VPAGHAAQVAFVETPLADEAVPAVHGVGAVEFAAHQKPGGQGVVRFAAPARQPKPAAVLFAHDRQVAAEVAFCTAE